jgi:hypothetical protein
MKTVKLVTILCLLAVWALAIGGCGGGKKADASKPISEVKAEAEKMDAGQLRNMAMTYKEAIEARKADMDKVAAKLREIPITKMKGDKAEQLRKEIETLTTSISALTERFEVYYNKLKEKGGNLSGLEL